MDMDLRSLDNSLPEGLFLKYGVGENGFNLLPLYMIYNISVILIIYLTLLNISISGNGNNFF